jgi:hypothetical protein
VHGHYAKSFPPKLHIIFKFLSYFFKPRIACTSSKLEKCFFPHSCTMYWQLWCECLTVWSSCFNSSYILQLIFPKWDFFGLLEIGKRSLLGTVSKELKWLMPVSFHLIFYSSYIFVPQFLCGVCNFISCLQISWFLTWWFLNMMGVFTDGDNRTARHV